MIGWSPLVRDAGTTTLNWNSPGATKPANWTVAVTPPIWINGRGDSVPDWVNDPLVTVTLVCPNPLAKIKTISPALAGVVEPG